MSSIRFIVAILFFIFFVYGTPLLKVFAFFLFLIGSITDYLDGYIARKYNLVSSLGKFLDPLADKFLTTSGFLAFVFLKIIPLWMVLIVIIRDITTTVLRTRQDKQLVTSQSAKFKTMFQLVFILITIFLVLVINNFPNDPLIQSIEWFLYSTYYDALMLIVIIFSLWTLVEYLKIEYEKK